MNRGPVLETPRLILRPHRLEDYEDCCFLTTDPEAVRMIFQKPMTREETWHRMLRFVGHWTLLGYGLLLVEEKATGRVVGEVGLADFHRGLGDDFDPFPEMAWMLTQDVHGRGYATEAAGAALRWMETAFAPERTVCIIDPDNMASLRVAEKLGFHSFGKADYKGKPVLKLRRFMSA
ncbi:GNAT family N-acetyltransferase [Rhizorhabdus dicambivorans]|uniref:N-acetyltransferase n=1 Tax=Rhizorhabdus dicambivorans TaxID=1850238 RepID=A0A2A4FV62_9SPHN|nr:GNAT family N-acetyltransferase [Rhizorhabdus dicambivorans]ATE64777.1 N-acetyltransferase [Rhizorhabdus dicambivorans]PCE41281.1 N-acetyltransferase [Rhizorhabdus dicambivorans]